MDKHTKTESDMMENDFSNTWNPKVSTDFYIWQNKIKKTKKIIHNEKWINSWRRYIDCILKGRAAKFMTKIVLEVEGELGSIKIIDFTAPLSTVDTLFQTNRNFRIKLHYRELDF